MHDKIYCCRSGSAADTQAIADYVKWYLELHSTELGEAPEVKTAANLFKQMCYHNKNFLLAAIICAGWDQHNGGGVYSITLGGTLIKEEYAISGLVSCFICNLC